MKYCNMCGNVFKNNIFEKSRDEPHKIFDFYKVILPPNHFRQNKSFGMPSYKYGPKNHNRGLPYFSPQICPFLVCLTTAPNCFCYITGKSL